MPAGLTPDMGLRRSGGSGDLRQGNLTQILRYVRDHGASSRHDIARGCGLGISTMTDLIGELRARRIVMELDPIRRPGAGRPTRPIDFDGEPWCVLGVRLDLDGFEFAAATLGGRELWRDSVPANLRGATADAGFAALDGQLRAQLTRLSADKRLIAVEIGVSGYIASDRATVGQSESPEWQNFPLSAKVTATLEALGMSGVHVGITNVSQLAALHAVRKELQLEPDTIAAYLGGRRSIGSGSHCRRRDFPWCRWRCWGLWASQCGSIWSVLPMRSQWLPAVADRTAESADCRRPDAARRGSPTGRRAT